MVKSLTLVGRASEGKFSIDKLSEEISSFLFVGQCRGVSPIITLSNYDRLPTDNQSCLTQLTAKQVK
jgi:hypothetical protein